MKIKSILICTGAAYLSLLSCKKESGSSKAFEGTWNFSGIHSQTFAENTYSDNGDESKTVTKSVYDSKNNTGTVKFAGGTATSTGVGYSVDTVLVAYYYDNNVLTDSTTESFSFTAPAGSSTSGYKLVGADSVSFTGSGLVNGGTTAGSPSGGHYSITDNKMTIITSVLKDSVAQDGTATLTIHEAAEVSIFLEK